MKKFLAMLSAVILTAVSIPFSVSAEELIAVNAANFPDDNFRSYISSELDYDGDGYLDDFECMSISINLYSAGEIKSLKGIELLTDLKSLSAFGSGLTEVDVSKNTKLESLTLSETNITGVDISNNTNLKYLTISNNPVTSVDISKNVNLEYLDIGDTGISNIDLSLCPNLTFLDCSNTPLTSLDLSAVPLLEYIDIYKCNIETLDISNNTALKTLYAREAGLTELDLSKNTALEMIVLWYNEIPVIDVSSCSSLIYLYVDRNPITVLDVTNCPALEILSFDQCDGVTEIDVSKNPLLERLDTNDKIDKLDVTNNPKLQRLDCRGSDITELDLSKNPLLNELYIEFCGKLTNIDLSNNTALEELWCTGCTLPFMNLDAQTAVTDFRAPWGISSTNLKGETFDMAQFPEGFDISRVTSVQNAVLDGTVLTVINPRQAIEYTYDAGGAVGEISFRIGISSVELTSALAREIPPQEYTGSEVCPFPELYCGEEQITAIDTEYNNNIEIGTASVTVTMSQYATLYEGSVTLEFEIVKATPEYEVPTGLSAMIYSTLGNIALPEGFSWEEPDTVLSTAGAVTAAVTYTPEDTEHYKIITGIEAEIIVEEPLKGDVNMDGNINITDATLLLKCYAEKGAGKNFMFSDDTAVNDRMLRLADVNEDGDTDITDASLILIYYAKSGAGIEVSWDALLK
ncbi:MAG: leucine-rich repeat domain-containing protein, partial [Ruminococcus sp.]